MDNNGHGMARIAGFPSQGGGKKSDRTDHCTGYNILLWVFFYSRKELGNRQSHHILLEDISVGEGEGVAEGLVPQLTKKYLNVTEEWRAR